MSNLVFQAAIECRPEERAPIEVWLGCQKRFARLRGPIVQRIQEQVYADWAALVDCGAADET